MLQISDPDFGAGTVGALDGEQLLGHPRHQISAVSHSQEVSHRRYRAVPSSPPQHRPRPCDHYHQLCVVEVYLVHYRQGTVLESDRVRESDLPQNPNYPVFKLDSDSGAGQLPVPWRPNGGQDVERRRTIVGCLVDPDFEYSDRTPSQDIRRIVLHKAAQTIQGQDRRRQK